MKTYKVISYAYPTSQDAEHFGMSKTGCYYIEIVNRGENHYSDIAPGSEGFLTLEDPKLHALFNEFDYPIEPMSLKYHPEYYTK